MPKQTVSEFFKNMFQRTPQVADVAEIHCHICGETLLSESMGPRILDRCPKCRGIWLSQAQLKEILEQVSHKAEGDMAAVESDGHADIGNTFAPSRLARKCPVCAMNMDNFKFEETGIWIDGCPQAHGIWLDQGELRLLAQRTTAPGQDSSGDQGTVLDAVSDLILGTL